jgi:hypothetical protein
MENVMIVEKSLFALADPEIFGFSKIDIEFLKGLL